MVIDSSTARAHWIDNGKMHRKEAVKLGRHWTALGHAVRIEPLHWKDQVRVYLKITKEK